MQNIYDKREIVNKINELREKNEEEIKKGNEDKAKEMLYAQFYAGLKLSVR